MGLLTLSELGGLGQGTSTAALSRARQALAEAQKNLAMAFSNPDASTDTRLQLARTVQTLRAAERVLASRAAGSTQGYTTTLEDGVLRFTTLPPRMPGQQARAVLSSGMPTSTWQARVEAARGTVTPAAGDATRYLPRQRGRALTRNEWINLKRDAPDLLRDWLATGKYLPPPEVLFPQASTPAMVSRTQVGPLSRNRAPDWSPLRTTSEVARVQAEEMARRGGSVYRPASWRSGAPKPSWFERTMESSQARQRTLETLETARAVRARAQTRSMSPQRLAMDKAWAAIQADPSRPKDPKALLIYLTRRQHLFPSKHKFWSHYRKVEAAIDQLNAQERARSQAASAAASRRVASAQAEANREEQLWAAEWKRRAALPAAREAEEAAYRSGVRASQARALALREAEELAYRDNVRARTELAIRGRPGGAPGPAWERTRTPTPAPAPAPAPASTKWLRAPSGGGAYYSQFTRPAIRQAQQAQSGKPAGDPYWAVANMYRSSGQ